MNTTTPDAEMKILFAIDIMAGIVVHGYKGEREAYRPLDWGLSKSVIPHEYIKEIGIRYPYLADLDRIRGIRDNDGAILACEGAGELAVVNRGARSPEDALKLPWIRNVVSTETCVGSPADYGDFDYFSVVVKDRRTIPDGGDPAAFLRSASGWGFEGCIILNLSSVGTGDRMGGLDISRLRDCHEGELLYGGGVACMDDLYALEDAGIDGVIIATAVHRGNIPVKIVQEGRIC